MVPKGTWTRFDLNISNFVFPVSMFIMINIEVHNAMSKFKTQISSYVTFDQSLNKTFFSVSLNVNTLQAVSIGRMQPRRGE